MPKVLITDCWTNKSLSIVRSLGRENFEVHAMGHKRIGASMWSRFVKKRFFSPNPFHSTDAYKSYLFSVISSGNYDCVIPLEETSIELMMSLAEKIYKIQPNTRLAIPPAAGYAKANDKWQVLQMAKKLSVPVPESFLPLSENELELVAIQLGFPLIMKPRSSSGSRGVRKINSIAELKSNYKEVSSRYGNPIIQKFLPAEGPGLGVGLLAKEGKILACYSYRRLREFPVSGGPSTLRETTDDQLIKDYSAKLIEELNWTGVAMVEFKTDVADDSPKLMEINPRFWGSVELAHSAGINFPKLLYDMLCGKEIAKPEYKTGIRCRWLLPGDTAHFFSNPKRFSLKPSFFNFFDKNTFYDEFKTYDLRGSIASFVCTLLSIFDPHTWKIGIFRK